MNRIPLIFNERQIARTVLGGTKKNKEQKLNVSVILLNSGGNFLRTQNIENLINCGFEEIISMETNSKNYNFEDFVKQFPEVKFVIPQEKVTDGDLINIGMSELKSEYVLVLRDCINISPFIISSNVLSKLVEKNKYCYVPRITVNNATSYPNVFSPAVNKGVFNVDVSTHIYDDCLTLFPINYVGLYNRQKFIQLGGFDYTIENPYWQNLDLSFRAFLWGEQISITTGINFTYLQDPPIIDKTCDVNQFRFYLKNLVPTYKLDHGEISRTALFRVIPRSPCGFAETISQFNDARLWVKKNQFRFTCDAVSLLSNWRL